MGYLTISKFVFLKKYIIISRQWSLFIYLNIFPLVLFFCSTRQYTMSLYGYFRGKKTAVIASEEVSVGV